MQYSYKGLKNRSEWWSFDIRGQFPCLGAEER